MRCAFSWATRPATANGCDPHAGTPSGGDIACAVVAPHAVRLLLGDVMGHDERAAQTAAEVARVFRRLAAHQEPLQVVATRLHAFIADHADGEEFVTAQFVSVPKGDAGEAQIVCCGHPPPLLLRGGQVTLLDALPPSPPLGLLDMGGYPPRADLLGARPGDSVLFYTDGVSEAYDNGGHPYPLAERAAALAAQPGAQGCCAEAEEDDRLPERLRDDLLDHVGGDLRDDATLLHLRFADAQAGRPVTEAARAPVVRY
ncbi:MAG: PP2C family protein-serine/threonine phosphatase [Trebonia sp.]